MILSESRKTSGPNTVRRQSEIERNFDPGLGSCSIGRLRKCDASGHVGFLLTKSDDSLPHQSTSEVNSKTHFTLSFRVWIVCSNFKLMWDVARETLPNFGPVEREHIVARQLHCWRKHVSHWRILPRYICCWRKFFCPGHKNVPENLQKHRVLASARHATM